MSEKTVVVIGGGITGLSVAYYLRKRSRLPCRIFLLEKDFRLGGQIQTEQRGSFLIEAGPESFVRYKKGALDLCRELGLEKQLLEPNSNFSTTFVLQRGRLAELPLGIFSPFSQPLVSLFRGFAFTPLLTWRAKLRMAAELFVPKKLRESDEPIREFISRRLGKEFFDVLLAPILTGIYGGDPSNLSTQTVLHEYENAERQSGGILRALLKRKSPPRVNGNARHAGGVFITLRGGLFTLVESLRNALADGCVHTNVDVKEIALTDKRYYETSESFRQLADGMRASEEQAFSQKTRYTMKTGRGESLTADAVILATPTHVCATLLSTIDHELASALEKIPYASSSVVTFAFRRSDMKHNLNGFGFLVPPKEKLCFTACTWSSSKWAGRAPEDNVLVRVHIPKIQANPEQLSQQALAELIPILGIKADPLLQTIHLHPASLPQYVVGHANRIRNISRLSSTYPGLFLSGAAYQGVGIPDCIQSAEATANQVVEYVERC